MTVLLLVCCVCIYIPVEHRRASCSDEEAVTISPHECSVEVCKPIPSSLSLSLSLSLFSLLLPISLILWRTHALTHTHHIIHATLGVTTFCLYVFVCFSHILRNSVSTSYQYKATFGLQLIHLSLYLMHARTRMICFYEPGRFCTLVDKATLHTHIIICTYIGGTFALWWVLAKSMGVLVFKQWLFVSHFGRICCQLFVSTIGCGLVEWLH